MGVPVTPLLAAPAVSSRLVHPELPPGSSPLHMLPGGQRLPPPTKPDAPLSSGIQLPSDIPPLAGAPTGAQVTNPDAYTTPPTAMPREEVAQPQAAEVPAGGPVAPQLDAVRPSPTATMVPPDAPPRFPVPSVSLDAPSVAPEQEPGQAVTSGPTGAATPTMVGPNSAVPPGLTAASADAGGRRDEPGPNAFTRDHKDALILNKLAEIQDLLVRNRGEPSDGTSAGLSLKARNNNVAFSVSAQSQPFLRDADNRRADNQTGGVQRSDNAIDAPFAFAYAPASLPAHNNPSRSETRGDLPLRFAYAPVYSPAGGGSSKPPVIASSVPLTFAYAPTLSSVRQEIGHTPGMAENQQVPFVNVQPTPNNATLDVPLAFAYSPAMSLGQTNLPPSGKDIPLTFAYTPAMSFAHENSDKPQSMTAGIPPNFTPAQPPYRLSGNAMNAADAMELPMTFAYAPATSRNTVPVNPAAPSRSQPRYRFAFGPPFSEPRGEKTSSHFWATAGPQTSETETRPTTDARLPPTKITIHTKLDTPAKPATKKTSQSRHVPPPAGRLSREKVYVEEVGEQFSSEGSYKQTRRFFGDRRFNEADEEDDDDDGGYGEETGSNGEGDDEDDGTAKPQTSRKRRPAYGTPLVRPPRPDSNPAFPPTIGMNDLPPGMGVYPAATAASFYMHQVQAPMASAYQVPPPMYPEAESFPPMTPPQMSVAPPPFQAIGPPMMQAYQLQQPSTCMHQQQPWPQQNVVGTLDNSCPEVGVVHTEERIEYDCVPGLSCQVQTDKHTTVSAVDSGVASRVLSQQHVKDDGREACARRQEKSRAATSPKLVVKAQENEKRLQLTPNVALKIARDVEESKAHTSQGEKPKEVEIRITEQVTIAMKDDDGAVAAKGVEENSAASSTCFRVEAPDVLVETRSEMEFQADGRYPTKNTEQSHGAERAESGKGSPCCKSLSPCIQSPCSSKPIKSGQAQPSLLGWFMNSCAMHVPSDSSSSSPSESSDDFYELVQHRRAIQRGKRKRSPDPRLQRLIKLERLLREKMVKNPELRKMLPEEEFFTKDEVARMQERQEREANAAAVQRTDEAAQTVDAAQSDVSRLIQLETDLKAELAKLQLAMKEPVFCSRAMVEDGHDKLRAIGETTIFDHPVQESPKKDRAMMRDFAVGVQYEVMEAPSPPFPPPSAGIPPLLPKAGSFDGCATKATEASVLIESSSVSEDEKQQGLCVIRSRKLKDGGIEILLSTQHKKESQRGDHVATTVNTSSSFVQSCSESNDIQRGPRSQPPIHKRQKTGISSCKMGKRGRQLPFFRDKASQTAKTVKGKSSRRKSEDRKAMAYAEFTVSTEESSDTAMFTDTPMERLALSRNKRIRIESSDSTDPYKKGEARRNSLWPRLSSIKITTRPRTRVQVLNRAYKPSSVQAPTVSKPSTRVASTRATTRTSTRAATTISSSSTAAPLLRRKRSSSVKPTSRCSYYENVRTTRAVSPRQYVQQPEDYSWQQQSDEAEYDNLSLQPRPSRRAFLDIQTSQSPSDYPTGTCTRHVRQPFWPPLEPHLLEREERSHVQNTGFDQSAQWPRTSGGRAWKATVEYDSRLLNKKPLKEQVLVYHQQNTGQGDLTPLIASRVAEMPEAREIAEIPASAPEHPPLPIDVPDTIVSVEAGAAPEDGQPQETEASQLHEPKDKQTATTSSSFMSRVSGKTSYETPAQSFPSYSRLKPREPRAKRLPEKQPRRKQTETVVYFLVLVTALACLLAVVDLFTSRGDPTGSSTATNLTSMTGTAATRRPAAVLQRSLNIVVPCHDFYSSACFEPTTRLSTDVVVVRTLEDSLLKQHDSPLRALWKECVDAPGRADAWAQFRQLLSTVSLEGWPFSAAAPLRPPAAVWEAAAHLLRLIGLPALAALSIRDHPDHQGKFIVALEPPDLLINASAAAHNWSVLWHTRAADAVLSAFGLQESGAAGEVTSLERRLALIAGPPDKVGRVERLAVLFRFRRFVAQTLNRLVHVSDATELWLRDPSFAQGLLLLLDESQVHVSLNYLGFRLVVRVAPFLPAVPGNVGTLVALHLAHGRALELDAAHACLRLAAQAQPHLALLAAYRRGRELFDRLRRLDFAGTMRTAVEARLQRSTGLLDAATRAQALRRLRRLEIRAFFPDWVSAPPAEEPLSGHGLEAFVEASSRMTALRQAVRPEARWIGLPTDGHCARGSRSLYLPASLADPSIARLSARASACLLQALLWDTPPSLFQRCFPSYEVFIDAAALPVAWEVFQATHQNTSRSVLVGELFFRHFTADLCHSRSRVILPLSTSSEFQSTFHCGQNDAMVNKQRTCAVWGS